MNSPFMGNSRYIEEIRNGEDGTGELKGDTDEGNVFWMEKEKLQECKLAPHMEKYLMVFEKNCQECFCTYRDGYEPHYR